MMCKKDQQYCTGVILLCNIIGPWEKTGVIILFYGDISYFFNSLLAFGREYIVDERFYPTFTLCFIVIEQRTDNRISLIFRIGK